MVAFILQRCACSAPSLVVRGEATPDAVATALDVAARLGAEVTIAGEDEVRCSVCGAPDDVARDAVIRVVDKVAAHKPEVPVAAALN